MSSIIMDDNEKAFVIAAIQIKTENDKKEAAKLKNKRGGGGIASRGVSLRGQTFAQRMLDRLRAFLKSKR